ncbi:MAG: polysaccharide biosynthesis protein, partial [Lachnospira sp.]|nr:polysaccharide biosynthesis protein [Lachnospira sp.]
MELNTSFNGTESLAVFFLVLNTKSKNGEYSMLNGKTILITGGTGSFGNHFVEYVLKNYKPKKIIIYSRDEYKQFVMSNKYKKHKDVL